MDSNLYKYCLFYSAFHKVDYVKALKSRAKLFLKRFKSDCFFERQYLVDMGLPVDSKDFKFTLMNAQHIVAKINGFESWKHFLDFVRL